MSAATAGAPREDGVPALVRMPYGGRVRAPELHDDSPETYYVHTPGMKVAIPSTPADAKGLLAAAIRDPDPVVILEPKLIYRAEKQRRARGRVRRRNLSARRGSRARGLTSRWSRTARWCRSASGPRTHSPARRRSRRSTSARSRPLDEDALLASAAKTGRVVIVQEAPRTAGFGAELAAILAEKAILDLRGTGAARDGLRRSVPVLEDRGLVHAVGRARPRPQPASSLAF